MLMFQVERLQVLRAPFLKERIARKRCHFAFIIICLCSFVYALPALQVFSLNYLPFILCFISYDSNLPIKYLYVATSAIFYFLPLTALPVLDVLLLIKIRQLSKAHLKLIKGANSNTNLNEIKAAASSVVVSTFMMICLTPNISWIPVANGTIKIH